VHFFPFLILSGKQRKIQQGCRFIGSWLASTKVLNKYLRKFWQLIELKEKWLSMKWNWQLLLPRAWIWVN